MVVRTAHGFELGDSPVGKELSKKKRYGYRKIMLSVRWCILTSILTYVFSVPTVVDCLHSPKSVCESHACKEFAWCEMCDKCLSKHHAVVKDEL